MKPSQSKFESLSKRLGAIDKERKQILQDLKSTPEFCIQYLNQLLNGIIEGGSKKWYSRTNDKKQQAYFQLESFEIIKENYPVARRRSPMGRGAAVPPSAPVKFSQNKKVLVKVKLVWKLYNYGASLQTKSKEIIQVSIFNDIEPQVLNGRVLATTFDEKHFVKLALNEKKSHLENELKKIKAEIASI